MQTVLESFGLYTLPDNNDMNRKNEVNHHYLHHCLITLPDNLSFNRNST